MRNKKAEKNEEQKEKADLFSFAQERLAIIENFDEGLGDYTEEYQYRLFKELEMVLKKEKELFDIYATSKQKSELKKKTKKGILEFFLSKERKQRAEFKRNSIKVDFISKVVYRILEENGATVNQQELTKKVKNNFDIDVKFNIDGTYELTGEGELKAAKRFLNYEIKKNVTENKSLGLYLDAIVEKQSLDTFLKKPKEEILALLAFLVVCLGHVLFFYYFVFYESSETKQKREQEQKNYVHEQNIAKHRTDSIDLMKARKKEYGIQIAKEQNPYFNETVKNIYKMKFSSDIQKELEVHNNLILIDDYKIRDVYFDEDYCYIIIKVHRLIITIKTQKGNSSKFSKSNYPDLILLKVNNVRLDESDNIFSVSAELVESYNAPK